MSTLESLLFLYPNDSESLLNWDSITISLSFSLGPTKKAGGILLRSFLVGNEVAVVCSIPGVADAFAVPIVAASAVDVAVVDVVVVIVAVVFGIVLSAVVAAGGKAPGGFPCDAVDVPTGSTLLTMRGAGNCVLDLNNESVGIVLEDIALILLL